MIDFLNSLMKTGATVKAPTSMADIKVQPISTGVDIVGMHEQAGQKVAEGFKKDVATNNQMNGLLGAMASAGANALGGGGKKQEQPMITAPAFRGDSGFQNPGAQSISGLRISGAPNLRGLLNG